MALTSGGAWPDQPPGAGPLPPPLPPPPRLLDLLREQVRYMHYSLRTEEAYVHWVRAFVRFHGLRHPAELSAPDIEAFLSWLASERQVSPSTHKQALSALLFLYQHVLGQDLPWMSELGRPKRQVRLPVVLTHAEVSRRTIRLLGKAQGRIARQDKKLAERAQRGNDVVTEPFREIGLDRIWAEAAERQHGERRPM